ncbi:DEAD/DEAH box helicase [Bacillus sp. D386]|uniref:DEAD/DEAH box helicase n=1 Tax=Bacillus sp. D386 TaxID=2587155 RepID=UPI0011236163|nr:DEAD/DEAH box helicase [Bacillus sp. D386]
MNTNDSIVNELINGLKKQWELSGFKEATTVQKETFGPIYEGKDVLAESPTGTGKTLAYVLPILNKIKADEQKVQAVILAPSRELVMQIFEVVQAWSKETGITAASFIGGANPKRQLEKLKKHPHVVIGTPGRLEELIKQKKLKMHEVKTIVLDEGDQLMIPEHLPTIGTIIKSTMRDRQIVLFSATLPAGLEEEAEQWMNDPVKVRVKKEDTVQSKVDHIYFVTEARDKINILEKLVKMPEMRALVFGKDIGNLDVMASKLRFKGVDLGVIHGDSKKIEREAAIREFRRQESTILLATDVAARGLDIKGLPFVIHVDFPETIAQYVHRSGRTGRQGESGTVISIVTAREERELKKYARELHIEVQKKELFKGSIVDQRPVYNQNSKSIKKKPNPKRYKK